MAQTDTMQVSMRILETPTKILLDDLVYQDNSLVEAAISCPLKPKKTGKTRNSHDPVTIKMLRIRILGFTNNIGTDKLCSILFSLRTFISILMFLALPEGAQVPPETIPNVKDASQTFSTWRRVRTDPQTEVPLEPDSDIYDHALNGNILYLVYHPEG